MAEIMEQVGTRSLMRDSCPTMEEVKDWVEDVTGFQVPDIVEECLTGGNGCPYESIEDAVVALESLGIQVPDSVGQCLSGDMDACEDVIDAVEAALDIEVPDSVEECLSGDMDSCEDAIAAVEAALGIEIPEEFIEMATACMSEVGL